MTFSSLYFIFCFLPTSLLLWIVISRYLPFCKKPYLIVLSLVFYTLADIQALPILILLSAFNLASTQITALLKEISVRVKVFRADQLALAFSIGVNCLVLCLFKYSNLVMPLGLSFYTFSAISYLVDSSRSVKSKHNLLDSLLFLLFFPKLVMGPIQTFKDFENQLTTLSFSLRAFMWGGFYFLCGLL